MKTFRTPYAGWPALAVAMAALTLLGTGCQRTVPPAVRNRPTPQVAPRSLVDPAYVSWLEERSMLYQARRQATLVSGQGVQWRHAYAEPQTQAAVRQASVWVLDYPGSVIPRPGQSVIATWGDPELWDLFRQIGIDLLHTGPINRAGGIRDREYTPSIDGWFDPIALEIDPQLGTEEEYRRLVKVAGERGGSIAGDLVPLHTGQGADFRLALMAYQDYPGMYTMVEIRPEDWPLLPRTESAWQGVQVAKQAVEELKRKGYVPGLINSCDAALDAREWSGWSASAEIAGVDGKVRRWVYLHYFKPGQPALNWLDPSFAGPRAVSGDIVRQVHQLGTRVIRLDAVPFLGVEPEPGKTLSKHFKHPLSISGTNYLAFLTRKLGGWTFHELNIPLQELKQFTAHGPDLSYDFFTRAQCLHALLAEDAAPLRQAFDFLQQEGIKPISLVHDLQNHDEITYQLVELEHRKDQEFQLNGKCVTGKQLRDHMLQEMRTKVAGKAAPHNKLYRPEQDGLATTFAGFVAAALGIADPYHATAEQVEQIARAHLLLAHANAMQPGIFSLSSWDLVGALPIPEEGVADKTRDGDFRWVNRGGVDLAGANPQATQSATGLPKAKALYGSLPQQLGDPKSFVSRLRRMLTARKDFRIAEAELTAVPTVRNPALCLLVLRLPGEDRVAITALNFGRRGIEEEVDLHEAAGIPLEKLRGRMLRDVVAGSDAGKVPDTGRLRIQLDALTGKTLVIQAGAR